ncbi:Exocyst complex component SEC5 [Spathaspora sp. JA1]|nr:Exocyst complex component SEC5 [Spathaspora sp. JA1]
MNLNPTDDELKRYYNISTLHLTNKDQLNYDPIADTDPEEITTWSKEDQFNLLKQLMGEQVSTGAGRNFDLHDPLRGENSNILQELLEKRLISSKNDPLVLNYLIGSQTFNSQKYLTTIHKDTPIEQLTNALAILETDIHSHTSELKQAIDDNFLKVINSKNSIDDILVDFKQQKSKAQQDRESSNVFNPNKQRLALPGANTSDLCFELESAINNMNTTTSLMIRPISELKAKEGKLIKMIEVVKEYRFFFDLPNILIEALSLNDNEKFLDNYNKFLLEKEKFLHTLDQERQAGTDISLKYSIVSKVFQPIDSITLQYRQKLLEELLSLDSDIVVSNKSSSDVDRNKVVQIIDNLMKLKNLDSSTTTSPIADFISNQLTMINKDFEYHVTKFENKFLLHQQKLLDYISGLKFDRQNGSHINYIAEKYNHHAITNEEEEIFDSSDALDYSLINETWLVLLNFIEYLDNTLINTLTKILNNYLHYNESIDPKGTIRDSYIEVINQVIWLLTTLFDSVKQETTTATTNIESSPKIYKQFVPYYSNSLSTVYYLTRVNFKINRILIKFGEFIGKIGNASKYPDTNKFVKNLKTSSSNINQKIIEAICSVWINDVSQFYDIEDWKTSQERYTNLVNIIEYYQIYIITSLSNLVFNKTKQEIQIVSAYPSKRTLVSIEIQFMRSLTILIDSIMKKYNIERATNSNDTFKILTMNNLNNLSVTIYPKLLGKFDKLFEKDLQKQNLKIFVDISKADQIITEDILNNEKLSINSRVNLFFKTDSTTNQLTIDGFIYEILIHFVKLVNKLKPLTVMETFINIINELQLNLLKNILDNIRQTQVTALQLINLKLDVNFILQIFERSKLLKFNEASYNLVQILLNTIEEKFSEQEYKYTKQEFDLVLKRNLQDSINQFSCF